MHTLNCAVQFNFVGKILGPKGNSLKRIQEETGTRMAVFGRGSMRDRHKVCVRDCCADILSLNECLACRIYTYLRYLQT